MGNKQTVKSQATSQQGRQPQAKYRRYTCKQFRGGYESGTAREAQGCLLRVEKEKDVDAEVNGQNYW